MMTEPVLVGGRAVYVVTGSHTQTINICTDANRRAVYDQVYRLAGSARVKADQVASHATVEELTAWLLDLGAVAEGPRLPDTSTKTEPAQDERIVRIEANRWSIDNGGTAVPPQHGRHSAPASAEEDPATISPPCDQLQRIDRLESRIQEIEAIVSILQTALESRTVVDDHVATPPTEPPKVEVPEPATVPIPPQRAQNLTEISTTQRTPAWEQNTLSLATLQADNVAREIGKLIREIGNDRARFVAVTGAESITWLRTALPTQFAVQSGVAAQAVLVYRYRGPALRDERTRPGYLLVDLLAMLSPSRLLSPAMYQRLYQTLPNMSLVPAAMRPHVMARMCWRRAVPATELKIDLAWTGPELRSELTELLAGLADDHPELADGLDRLTTILNSDQVQPVQVHRPVTTDMDADLDLAARRAEARESTRRAQEALVSLEDRQLPPPAVLPFPVAPVGANALPPAEREFAGWLATSACHQLKQAREAAAALGMVPLDAIRRINEWAERRAAETSPDLTVVEVDGDVVWVHEVLVELLAQSAAASEPTVPDAAVAGVDARIDETDDAETLKELSA